MSYFPNAFKISRSSLKCVVVGPPKSGKTEMVRLFSELNRREMPDYTPTTSTNSYTAWTTHPEFDTRVELR